MSEPLYTMANCRPAYQLRWSLALFPQQPIPPSMEWVDSLKSMTETDGVRILECQFQDRSLFFVISTRPDIAPPQIVKSIKGRLQNLIQKQAPQAFRRNFRLTSLGDASRETIDSYVARQLGHHLMSDARVNKTLTEFQFEFPEVDLSLPERSAHAEYLYNLHVVLVHAERWNESRHDCLKTTSDMILRCAQAKKHRLSRVSLLADHVHLALRAPYDVAPGEIAVGYLNNIAFAHGMKPFFASGYYVGTFGEYDMNAVRL